MTNEILSLVAAPAQCRATTTGFFLNDDAKRRATTSNKISTFV
jgi:hypothetical protein